MPTFRILRGATAYNISADQPIRLVDVDDLGGADVRNLEESGPYQDGVSHLGERLEPSNIVARFNVIGATAAELDGYRDTLNAMFKPVRGVPITFEVTRDDGEVRRLDTHRAGRLGIALRPENHPGHLHRAVVQLRAGDPTWYNADEEEATFLGPSDWWLAYNTIGTANVLEHVESPTQGQLWANSGSVADGSAWSVVFRSGSVVGSATAVSAFGIGVDGANDHQFWAQSGQPGGYLANAQSNYEVTGVLMEAGTQNYIMNFSGGTLDVYRGTALQGSDSTGTPKGIKTAAAGTARWRALRDNNPTNYWPVALPRAAAYKISLSETQRIALNQSMASGGSEYINNIAYQGDWDSYPVITITGPIANPIITNTATGDVLNFSVAGGTIAAGSAWVIDTRYGRKSVLNGTVSVANYLSDDSDSATFRLVPDPVAAGGTNTVTLSGSATGTATAVGIVWFNRFLDY